MITVTPHYLVSTILVLSFISGCIDATPNSLGGEQSESIGSSSLPLIEFIDCINISTTVPDPETKYSQDLPANWYYGEDDVPSRILSFFFCDRVAIGSFERESVNFLIESTFGPQIPESCQSAIGGGSQVDLVTGSWTDNPDLQVWFQKNASLPFESFQISSNESDSIATSFEIQWIVYGQRNSLEIFETPDEIENRMSPRYRFFWESDAGLHAAIFSNLQHSDSESSFASNGQVGDPHLNPNPLDDGWRGAAEAHVADHSIQLHSFGDSKCE